MLLNSYIICKWIPLYPEIRKSEFSSFCCNNQKLFLKHWSFKTLYLLTYGINYWKTSKIEEVFRFQFKYLISFMAYMIINRWKIMANNKVKKSQVKQSLLFTPFPTHQQITGVQEALLPTCSCCSPRKSRPSEHLGIHRGITNIHVPA